MNTFLALKVAGTEWLMPEQANSFNLKKKDAAHKLPTGNNSWKSPTPAPCLGTILDSGPGHGLKSHQGTS